MKVITREEATEWCDAHLVALDGRCLPARPGSSEGFKLPVDAGQRVHLVADRMASFLGPAELLVWFDDWSVWPSGQRMHLFDRLRLRYGDSRPLSAAPAQTFEASEFEDAVSFVTLGVLFLFDCYVVCAEGGRMLFFSHDEHGWAASRSRA